MATPPTVSVPTLYHVQWFSSSMPYQVILELDLPASQLAVKKITDIELKTLDYIETLCPRRVVPFLQFPDNSSLVESAAIVMYILESFDKSHKLHPAIGDPKRPKFFQGLIFAVAEGYKSVVSVFMLCYQKKKEERNYELIKPAKQKFMNDFVGHLERELEGDFYLGDEFSAVDVLMGYVLMTAEFCDEQIIASDGKVREYFDRLQKRDSYCTLYSPENAL